MHEDPALTLDLDPPNLFADWIARHVLGDTTGQCRFWAEAMQEVFPDLILTRGHAQPPEPVPGRPQGFAHWWLVAPDGTIVDPTAAQYPWPLVYVPWEEGAPEPTGRCPHCGGHAYQERVCCSEACALAYAATLMARH